MLLTLTQDDPFRHSCRALVVGFWEDSSEDGIIKGLDALFGGTLQSTLAAERFSGKAGTTRIIHSFGRIPAERLLLVGLGKRGEGTLERMRQGAGGAAQVLRGLGIETFSTMLHFADPAADSLRATAEGILLGGYTFDRYKTGEEPAPSFEEVTFLCRDGGGDEAKAALRETSILGEGVLFARDLVAQPGNVATPEYLARTAEELAQRCGLRSEVLRREDLERLGMEGILAVARGSRQEPRFIVLDYPGGPERQKPVVLVGKGVTFDSGGISLKPREGMERMKNDMAGAAAVLGTLRVVAELKLPLNVIGLVPAAENLPGGAAYKPGDIVRTMSGKTVEIVNTDAEGRMLLCDALHYARKYRPSSLVDIATLTGACVVALGSGATGLMGTSPALLASLKRAGEKTGERVWELPVWDDYGEIMKSDIADLKNAGGPGAGAISAGWFLKQFAGKAPWAHLDIAGTAWEEKGRHYQPKGATGVGVRLLVEYLRDLCR